LAEEEEGKEDEGLKPETKEFFKKLKRPYTLEDVKLAQEAFWAFEEMRRQEHASYKLNKNSFYEFLVSGSLSPNALPEYAEQIKEKLEKEREPSPSDYEKLTVDFVRQWRENLIKNKEQVLQDRPGAKDIIAWLEKHPLPPNLSLEKLRNTFRQYPELAEFSAAVYQDLQEEGVTTGGFLHFHGHRHSGYQYEKPADEYRIYLNPPKEALPKLAQRFIELADQEQTPFYFKLIDFSLPRLRKEDETRLDRMLFYADSETVVKITKIIGEIRAEHPEWFEARPMLSLVAKPTEGVGLAASISESQRQKFGQETSFNDIRAKMLFDSWRDALGQIIHDHPEVRPRGGRTIKELFDDLSREHKEASAEDTLSRMLSEVAPFLQSESLLPYVQDQIRKKAPEYGVDPNNLAFNK
jgi:hypothetical protein